MSNDQSTSTTPRWHLMAVSLQRAEPGGCNIMSHPSRFWLFSLGCQRASGTMSWRGQAGDQWPACQGLPGVAVARGEDGCLQPPAEEFWFFHFGEWLRKRYLIFLKFSFCFYKIRVLITPQVAHVLKNPPANAGDARDSGSIPETGRSP